METVPKCSWILFCIISVICYIVTCVDLVLKVLKKIPALSCKKSEINVVVNIGAIFLKAQKLLHILLTIYLSEKRMLLMTYTNYIDVKDYANLHRS